MYYCIKIINKIFEIYHYYCKVATSIENIIYKLTLVQEPISVARVATINIVKDTNSIIPLKCVKMKTIDSFSSQLQSYKNSVPSHNNMPYSSSFHITNRRICKTLHISHITLQTSNNVDLLTSNFLTMLQST